MKRLALCVGINDYPGTDNDLSGCVNDALDWASLLKSRGYSTDVLLDGAATKANIVSRLVTAVKSLRYRDKFVFTFSGHGTWVPDTSGDEFDRRDEALCCHEVWEGGILTDDEMHAIWQPVRYGVQLTTLSDSCHSGTVARRLFAATSSRTGKPKFLSPALLPTVPVSEAQAIRAEAVIAPAKSRPGPVLLSGCDDPEYSYDAYINGRYNGAFTRTAIDTLSDSRNFREWHKRIRTILPNSLYPQSPQLGATKFQSYRRPLD